MSYTIDYPLRYWRDHGCDVPSRERPRGRTNEGEPTFNISQVQPRSSGGDNFLRGMERDLRDMERNHRGQMESMHDPMRYAMGVDWD